MICGIDRLGLDAASVAHDVVRRLEIHALGVGVHAWPGRVVGVAGQPHRIHDGLDLREAGASTPDASRGP